MREASNAEDVRVCPDCDQINWVSGRTSIRCKRCGHLLGGHPLSAQHTLALIIAALILLIPATEMTFVGYRVSGQGQQITLLDSSLTLSAFHEQWLAIVVLLSVVILPALFLLASGVILIWHNRTHYKMGRWLVRAVKYIRVWMMADVFLIGALISFIKLAGYATIDFGFGVIAFAGFVTLLMMVVDRMKRHPLWPADERAVNYRAIVGESARQHQVVGCPVCYAANPAHQTTCWRCHEPLWTVQFRRTSLTFALLLAAALMLIPAQVLPIMETVALGSTQPQTIVGGVLSLWQSGDIPIAIIVFVASLVIPIAKILILATLAILARQDTSKRPKSALWLYRITDWIGRWSMIDIFVVAVLVALVRNGALMSVYPGHAAIAFASTVILTMLAAMSFDTRQFWVRKSAE
jgi:paraquat-inducible protein A